MYIHTSQIVPTLCVGMHHWTLRVRCSGCDAERRGLHSHAERGNDHQTTAVSASTAFTALSWRICSQPHNTRSGVAGASIFG
ncbi:hypothetical protein DMX03_25665 [Pseudomonas koreensis]|nr:hypothetical protein BSZ28_17800 [Pseudomonas moraviensis]PYB80687.1 hypothetical protein DMX03_25665 [Pseudomonas koreensis]RRW60765.1 hypothetical protein EGJ53_24610 [Pseudomonas fluorescens]